MKGLREKTQNITNVRLGIDELNVQKFQYYRGEAFAVQDRRQHSNLMSANASPLRVTINKVAGGLIYVHL
jgi:hypothetical protein